MSDSVFQEVANKLKSSIKKVEFENGLKLIMMKRTSSPTLALYTKFRVGSADETPEIAGTAHLLEHMLFKGTHNVGTTDWENEKKFYALLKATGSELDKLRLEERHLHERGMPIPKELEERMTRLKRRLKSVEEQQRKYMIKSEDNYIYQQHGQVGFNAYTTHDVTNYQIKLPANRLEIWAKMESDRLKNPILREYYTERDVIMEERRMRVENRGFGMLREKFLSVAFEQSPYGRPVIGYESNIPFLDIYDTEEFFRNYYTPDNMVIAIVGDLDFEETESMIKKYFSDLKPSKKKREQQRVKERLNIGERRIQFEYPGGSIFMMGFHKPPFPTQDDVVFSLIDTILTQGAESRLYQSLVLKEQLCSQVSAWSSDPGERYSNLFNIFAYLNSDTNPEKLEEVIWAELERLKKGEISDEEVFKAKNKITGDFLRQVDSNASLADGLTYYELLTNNWEDLFLSYDRLNSVTKEDIQKVSQKYFQKSNSIIGFLDSRGKK
jgi:predicted Zn-dependent peptidase